MEKVLEYLTTNSEYIATGLFGTLILFGRIKAKIQQLLAKRNNAFFKKSIEKNENVERLLIEITAKYECSRSMVVLFHNGSYFNNGSSIERLTCAYEKTAIGVNELKYDWTNILISHTGLVTENILTASAPTIFDVEKASVNDTWRLFLMKYGINVCIARKIVKKSQVVGFVLLHFDEFRRDNYLELDLLEFNDKASLIEYLL